MALLILAVTVGLWLLLFRRRAIGTGSLAILWLMVVTLVGGFFFVSGIRDIGWSPTGFVVAGLLALFPILFLMGLVAVSKRGTDLHKKAVIRLTYGTFSMVVIPFMYFARILQRSTHDPSDLAIGRTLAYSAYVMMAMAIITMFLGLATILRDRASGSASG